jgi:hypothetical protein
MKLHLRYFGSLSLLSCLVAAANAGAYGTGGADNQTWILSMGSDVVLANSPLSYFLPSGQVGSGIAGGTETTNMPLSGGVYYNTNSFTLVPTHGSSYEESGEGNDYFFTNYGSQVESVTMGWQGYVSSMTTASGPGEAWDYAESYMLDANLNTFAFNISFESVSPGISSGSQFGSGDYTFYLNPGETDVIQSLAYNESYSVSNNTTPSPMAVLPFVTGLIGLARRKRAR